MKNNVMGHTWVTEDAYFGTSEKLCLVTRTFPGQLILELFIEV